MRAFWSVKKAGGSKMTLWEIVVSGGSNFDTDPTNSVSYESWQPQLKFETSLRSVRLIVWPQEVSKVTEVKMKKSEAKILESPIFDLQKRNIPQKKPQENLHSYLKQNKRLLLWKNWKKVDFAIFTPKKL